MLDIKFIKENVELVKAAARRKQLSINLDELLELDEKRLKILNEVERLRAEQKEVGAGVVNAVEVDRDRLIAKLKVVKDNLKTREARLQVILRRWQTLMLEIPNLPDFSVPDGATDADNQEIRRWGEIPKFDFAPKNHWDLMSALGLADFERGAKVAGFRGYFLLGGAAELSFALWQFAFQWLRQAGFEPVLAPSLVRPDSFIGTGYLPGGIEDLFRSQDEKYFSGTAEVPTMGYLMDEIIAADTLPRRFAAFSVCFRREAGNYGRDAKGLFRVHEFYKVEQVVLCAADHEESVRWHEALTANSEKMLQALNLPYRVVVNCAGDLGLGQVKKYDLETWLPSENRYRETHSASYFHDFQTRRLNIRYRDAEGKLRYPHSVNNTAVATPRLLAALIENNQQADGSINVPEPLRPILGRDKLVGR